MKVNLIQKATFDFKEDGYTAIPNDVFNKLVVIPDNVEDTSGMPTIQMFKTMADYATALKNEVIPTFDTTKPVYVNGNGNVFVYLLKDSRDGEFGDISNTKTLKSKKDNVTDKKILND